MTQFRLTRSESGLCLDDTWATQHPLLIDYTGAGFRRRLREAGRKSELIVKAVKPEPGMKVLDCTAGLGIDSFLLAWSGCEVVMVERSKVIHALLEDALDRAVESADLIDTVARISLVHGDSLRLLKQGGGAFDVACLDPMFPVKTGTALVKGDMQILQRFLGPGKSVVPLLDAALDSGAGKIVLKRPPRGTWEPPRNPDHTVSSRSSHLEVYLGKAVRSN